MMIDTTEVKLQSNTSLTIAFIQVHSCMRKQNLRCYFLSGFVIGVDEIWCIKSLFGKEVRLCLLAFECSWTIRFERRYDSCHLAQVMVSFMDLGLPSRGGKLNLFIVNLSDAEGRTVTHLDGVVHNWLQKELQDVLPQLVSTMQQGQMSRRPEWWGDMPWTLHHLHRAVRVMNVWYCVCVCVCVCTRKHSFVCVCVLGWRRGDWWLYVCIYLHTCVYVFVHAQICKLKKEQRGGGKGRAWEEKVPSNSSQVMWLQSWT